MKKTFITPKAEVKAMEPQSMICNSTVTVKQEKISGGYASAKMGGVSRLHAQDILLDI